MSQKTHLSPNQNGAHASRNKNEAEALISWRCRERVEAEARESRANWSCRFRFWKALTWNEDEEERGRHYPSPLFFFFLFDNEMIGRGLVGYKIERRTCFKHGSRHVEGKVTYTYFYIHFIYLFLFYFFIFSYFILCLFFYYIFFPLSF